MSKLPPRITDTPVKWFMAIMMAIGAVLVGLGVKRLCDD